VDGTGTLRPVEARLITAGYEGRIDRIRVYPGTAVMANTVILNLTNWELVEGVQSALCQVQAAEGDLASVKARNQETLLDKKAALAVLKATSTNAKLELDSLEALARHGLVANLSLLQARARTEDLLTRYRIEQERLQLLEAPSNGQLAIFQSKVDGARALLHLKQDQLAALTVRAGMNGVLQSLSVQVGERVGPGTTLAKVVEPGILKAELKISDLQAKDIHIGQAVTINTRNGLVDGKVVRIDPEAINGSVTVDASLEGSLPRGTLPGLNVTASIKLGQPSADAPAAATTRTAGRRD